MATSPLAQPAPQIPPGFELEPEPAIPPGFELAPPEDATKPSEPIKPNNVDRPSAATPNPPTAFNPTAPEKPETLDMQLQQLGSGIRRAVMLPKGSGMPSQFPPGTSVTHDGLGNNYIFRPDLIRKSEIHSAAKNNKLTEVLGSSKVGMGAPDKSALGPDPVTVVSRGPNGAEAQSIATDERHFPATMLAAKHLTPRGGRISVEPASRVIRQRAPFVSAPPLQDFGTPAELK